MPDVVAVFINKATTLYATLSSALKQYATQVSVPAANSLDKLEKD